MGFCHLHLHTSYSPLDGLNKIPEVIAQAKKLGQKSIAMTDHGNLSGAIEFYSEANKQGIKPIIGSELYVVNNRREKDGSNYHLTVLASNIEGYKNLCRLSTLSYTTGFYSKPRVDLELLGEHSSGLIVLSGCLGGELANSNCENWDKLIENYARIFKDNYFLEIQPHQITKQQEHNEKCLHYAKKMGIPLVCTGDCHYTHKEDKLAQKVLTCVSVHRTLKESSNTQDLNLHLYSESEMLELLRNQEAIDNTELIASKCNLELELNKPRLNKTKKLSADSFKFNNKEYKDRIEYEIEVINKLGFAEYFLIVSDFINFARSSGIPVGPGRGSVAGSLVAFSLGITTVDPIKHGLLFERFLNPSRVTMPDIDVDFCIHGREKVVEYVKNKYGKENVSKIATFGTLGAKAALKDVGRTLGIDFSELNAITKLIPAPRQGFAYSLKESIELEPRLKDLSTNRRKELFDIASKVEGLTRHISTHAAGVVISDRPLIDLVPLATDKNDEVITQYDMQAVEKIGLVKFDFLGLRTLTIINDICLNVGIDIKQISFSDSKVYNLISKGETVGIFQLEGAGITEVVKRLKPDTFDKLAAILALYRPGPLGMGMVDSYIKRATGQEKPEYRHKRIENILRDTYGIIVYQEQVMQLAVEIAGYTFSEADDLRKAMGKKELDNMAQFELKFLEGCKRKGFLNKVDSEFLFLQIKEFARYGFNKSHSVAYAYITYQTAYLKTHYPKQFMAALLSYELDDAQKTWKNLQECARLSIFVCKPEINESNSGFTVSGDRINFGLRAVNSVGSASEIIIKERGRGPFLSFWDFLLRCEITKDATTSLIDAGAFDKLIPSRKYAAENLDKLKRLSALYDLESPIYKFNLSLPETAEEYDIEEKLRREKDASGFYFSGHPMDFVNLKQDKSNIAGIVCNLELKNFKDGSRFCTFKLENKEGLIDCIVWPDIYRRYSHLLIEGRIIFVSGSQKDTETYSVSKISEFKLPNIEKLTLIVNDVRKIAFLAENKGVTPCFLIIKEEEAEMEIKLPFGINLSPKIYYNLIYRLGKESVLI